VVLASTLIARLVTNQSELGRRLQIGQARVARWCSPLFDETPSLARLVDMIDAAPEIAGPILQWLVDRLERRAPISIAPALHGGRIAKETGEAVMALCCPSKSRTERRAELLEARAAIDEALRDIDAEGTVG
jgi:hypothetical protein